MKAAVINIPTLEGQDTSVSSKPLSTRDRALKRLNKEIMMILLLKGVQFVVSQQSCQKVKILDAITAVDKEWNKLEKVPA